MRPISHRREEADEGDDSAADPLDPEEAMAGEEKWLEVQEF